MATIKYIIQSNSNASPIYLRLSISKNKSLKRKTGLNIDSKKWSTAKGLPKQNETTNKSLLSDLLGLRKIIHDKLNEANSNGKEINGDWLSFQIDLHFKRISESNLSEMTTDVIQNIIDSSHLRENSKGGIGLSKSRINSYKRLLSLFKDFQGRKRYKTKELNKNVFEAFKSWLLDKQKYSATYSYKKIADLKTVCLEARSQGIDISPDIIDIKTKHISAYDDDMDVITLSFNEIELIEEAQLINEAHINARKWLILACYTGQRGEDLTKRIVAKNFEKYGDDLIIKIKQQKGNKAVIIPVLPKVKDIYESGLPYPVSTQKLNKYFKKIGESAGLNEMVLGRLRDKETQRGMKKLRPKYQYMSTHIGRRSFATNHYGKIPTPLLMKVTQHSKESTFLKYINQTDDSHIESFLKFYDSIESNKSEKVNLKVVREIKNLKKSNNG